MFAVPGWAVDPSTLAHEPAKSRNGKNETNPKKRKRATEAEDTQPLTKISPVRPRTKNDEHQKTSATFKSGRSDQNTTQIPSASVNGDDKPGIAARKNRKQASPKDGAEKRRVDSRVEVNEDAREPKFGKAALSSSASNTSAATQVKLTPLQAKMRSKLTSARFRHLNETLYTSSSGDALAMFTSSPDLFADYHAGFAQQVKESWPQNPVDGYVRVVKVRGALSEPSRGVQPLPRRKTGSCTIADLGCGDAPLARGCQANVRTLQLRFHNYDLHAVNTLVTKADMTDLPLRDGEVDIAVFCLSLMGTNWVDFVEEAWRILRGDGKGEVWVAEVKSRFGRVVKGRVVENSVGKRKKIQKRSSSRDGDGDDFNAPEQFVEDERSEAAIDDETDISAFVKVFTRRGFQLREGSINKSNKMFVSMVFTKSGIPTAGKHKGLKWNGKEYTKQQDGKLRFTGAGRADNDEVSPEDEAKVLKPCVYKAR